MPEKIFVRRVKRLGKAFAAARRLKDIIKIYVYYVVCFRGVTATFYRFRPQLFLVKHVKTPYCARPWQTALRHICAVGQTPPTSPAITPSNDRRSLYRSPPYAPDCTAGHTGHPISKLQRFHLCAMLPSTSSSSTYRHRNLTRSREKFFGQATRFSSHNTYKHTQAACILPSRNALQRVHMHAKINIATPLPSRRVVHMTLCQDFCLRHTTAFAPRYRTRSTRPIRYFSQ